jgi:hypothetical protein
VAARSAGVSDVWALSAAFRGATGGAALRSVALNERQRTIGGETSVERVLTKLQTDARRLGTLVRRQSSIENQLHWRSTSRFAEMNGEFAKPADWRPASKKNMQKLTRNLLEREMSVQRCAALKRCQAG